jgi:hypothetical protein
MIGQTKLVEDAWQRMKVVERRGNDNTRMSNVKRWLVPVQTQVASSARQWCQYPEVAADAHHAAWGGRQAARWLVQATEAGDHRRHEGYRLVGRAFVADVQPPLQPHPAL